MITHTLSGNIQNLAIIFGWVIFIIAPVVHHHLADPAWRLHALAQVVQCEAVARCRLVRAPLREVGVVVHHVRQNVVDPLTLVRCVEEAIHQKLPGGRQYEQKGLGWLVQLSDFLDVCEFTRSLWTGQD